MSKAIGLFSGGLDSILAVRVLTDQDIEVLGVTFVTPFFGSERAEATSKMLNIPLRIVDISEEHLAMVKAPPHGYGKTMNPCIDCHALMLKRAGEIMEAEGYDFLFTGEVLNERPMSQNRKALEVVAAASGYPDVIVRPLSAQLLKETKVEREGLVDRCRLLALSGRTRKPQIALAQAFGISDYPTPAGGCLLTEKQFSLRLRDLFDHNADSDVRDVSFLTLGRHFRLDARTKLVCGRNRDENLQLESLAGPDDLLLSAQDVPGPTAVLVGDRSELNVKLGASLVVRYSDVPSGQVGKVRLHGDPSQRIIAVRGATQEQIDTLLIR